ncbi:DUF630 family protein (DUF630 and DUF632) [Rhynchospora pubera]|uniref:DUF630 family protein (DUF630 and DUF632) n=1 Tax=Rhynchospora pubera TaxID=906938 RepID=A0AAV8FGB4_9POAL|nr:DUF630 family protein (DUF630 and DUF632) [Rhynchospora pubera]
MGASGSKPRSDEALLLCKERTQYIREAIDAWFALSAAHLSYMQSLRNIGPAIREFTESELLSDPALSVSEPDKSPSHSSIASPTHGEIPLSPPVQPIVSHMRATGTVSSVVTATVDPVTLSDSVGNLADSGSSWDYFDPNVNPGKGLRQVKEKEVLPLNDKKCGASGTEVKGDLGEEEVEREDESEFITHRAKEFVPSIKEIEHRFARAAEAGDEVARMLETNKVRLSVSSVVFSGTPSSSRLILAFNQFCCKRDVLLNQDYTKHASKVITWNRSVSSISSSSKDHLACVPKDSSGEIGRDFAEQFSMISGSHSSTLDRLYAWERKLYDEIKASECIRRAYDQKCALLRHQFARDMKAHAIDKTRAAIKDLHSRLSVAIQAVNSISKRIEKMRDEELQPQLVELIHGLIRMWKAMLECHHAQFITISLAYHVRRTTKLQVETQNHILTHLLEEIDTFASTFANWINSQKSYIQSLDSWLQKCILQPRERRRGRRKAIFPPPQALSPPIFVLCRDWLAGLKSLPLDELLEVVRAVSTVLRDAFEQRSEDTLENGDDGRIKEMERFQSVLRAFFDRFNKFAEASLKASEEVKNNHEVARAAYKMLESGDIPLVTRVSL